MPIFDRKAITPHRHTEALKRLGERREHIIRELARAKGDKVDALARDIFYLDHALASLNGNDDAQSAGQRMSYTDS